jgi:hypothetical protein
VAILAIAPASCGRLNYFRLILAAGVTHPEPVAQEIAAAAPMASA